MPAIRYTPVGEPGSPVVLDSAGKLPAVDGSQLTNIAAAAHAASHLAAGTDQLYPLSRYSWTFDTGTADADPGLGRFRFNNVNPSLATFLYISDNGVATIDLTQMLQALRPGDRITQFRPTGVVFNWLVSGTPTSTGTYIKVPVSGIVAPSPPPNNEVQTFVFHPMSRVPEPHAATHNVGGGDVPAIDAAAATGSYRTLGTGALQACAGNDARLSDARPVLTGATLWVDAVNGNDGTGLRGRQDKPFLTVQAAVTTSVAGDLVRIRAGTYTSASQITMKDGVSVVGEDRKNVILTRGAGAGSGTMILMADSMRLSNLTIKAVPSSGTVRCVSFEGTTCATSTLTNVDVVGLSTATGFVQGVGVLGTGVAAPNTHSTGENCFVSISGGQGGPAGFGDETTTSVWRRCLFLSTSGTLSTVGFALPNNTGSHTAYFLGCQFYGLTSSVDVGLNAVIYVDPSSNFIGTTNFHDGGSILTYQFNFPRHQFAGGADPTRDDDITLGYGAGSVWVNTVSSLAYLCISAADGAAVWRGIGFDSHVALESRQTPGETFYGSLLDYGASSGATAQEIQYVRVWLQAGIVVTNMRYFQVSGGSALRNVRLGIYDNSVGGVPSPSNPAGIPGARLQQTDAVPTLGLDGTFVNVPLAASYSVLTTGYYWLAMMQGVSAVTFAVTNSFRANYLPVRREAGAGLVLPATAGVLTNPASALIYVSAL